jgi:Transposase DDE domain
LCALDGSTVSGPGATGTDARLHTNIRLSDLRILEAQVTDPSVGETFKNFSFEPGQLVLADRGYSNAPGIAWVREHQADVLVRLNRGALPVFDPEDGQPLDVLAWVRSLPDDTAVERAVVIKDGSGPRCQRIEGRLVATRLPPTQTQEARARVQREQGSDASSDTIEMAGYVVLFTTTPSSRLSAARCLEAYRLRWQVELLFKRWKSLGGMDELPNQRDDTTLAWLYVKLLLGLIVERLGSASAPASAELSPPVRLVQHERPARTRQATALAAALEGRHPALARGHRSRASPVAR